MLRPRRAGLHDGRLRPGEQWDASGRDISFDLGTSEFHHTGTVSATTMAGTAQWSIDFGIPVGVVTLSGSWNAAKQ